MKQELTIVFESERLTYLTKILSLVVELGGMDTKVIDQGDIFGCEELNNFVSPVLCEYVLYKEAMNDLNMLLTIN